MYCLPTSVGFKELVQETSLNSSFLLVYPHGTLCCTLVIYIGVCYAVPNS